MRGTTLGLLVLVACHDALAPQPTPAFDLDDGTNVPVISAHVASSAAAIAPNLTFYAWTSGTVTQGQLRLVYADSNVIGFNYSIPSDYLEVQIGLADTWPCRIVWKAWASAADNCAGCVAQVDSLVLWP